MNQRALVSIIVPTYNRCGLLSEAVRSCLAQSLAEIDLLICDNASTDDTPKVARELCRDPRVRYKARPENIGGLRNISRAVIEEELAPFVLIMSDDDKFCDYTYLEDAYRLISGDPRMGFVHGNVEIVNRIEGTSRIPSRRLSARYLGREFFLGLGTAEHDYAYLMTVLVRRDLARQVRFFADPDLPHGDSLAWLRCALVADVGYIDRVVAHYILHGSNSIGHPDLEVHLADIRFYLEALADARASGLFTPAELASWQSRMRAYYCGGIIEKLGAGFGVGRAARVILRLQRQHGIFADAYLARRSLRALVRCAVRRRAEG
jgi:glycosyltransferase involved in cell wall biosynthesis